MRIIPQVSVILVASVVFFSTACSSGEDLARELGVEQPSSVPPVTSSQTTEPATPSATPTPTVTRPSDSIAHVDALAGGEYFQSERRQAPLHEVLLDRGTKWRDMMLSGEIPAVITGWETYAPPPARGYGSIKSLPSEDELKRGEVFIQVDVKITDGRVDTREEPLGLHIITADGQSLQLIGREPLVDTASDGSGIRAPGSPLAYTWTWLNPDGSHKQHMFLVYADDSMSVVPADRPIDTSREYVVFGEGGYKTPGMINEEDATFLSHLNSLNVSGSNWDQ